MTPNDDFRVRLQAVTDQAAAAWAEEDSLEAQAALMRAVDHLAAVLSEHGMPASMVAGNVAGAVTTRLVMLPL